MWEYTYIELFWELNTERRYESGPIPLSKVKQSLIDRGISLNLESGVKKLIRKLDNSYLNWLHNNRKELARNRKNV